MEDKYRVIYSGEIFDGFNLNQVEEGFSRLFKINPERAANYLIPNRVIKENISQKQAQSYKQQLEKIGLMINLECQVPEFSSVMMELETVEEGESDNLGSVLGGGASANVNRAKQESLVSNTLSSAFVPAKVGVIFCPKCQLEQKVSKQCIGCGKFFHKSQSQKQRSTKQESTFNPYQPLIKNSEKEGVNEQSKSLLPYLVVITLVVAGVYIWMFVEQKTEFLNWISGL